MSDTFLNSQEVTAEDLNNIAIDLGYADYSHFPEDPPQSAVSALNQITADLTSAGILQIGNKCTVSITDNTIVVQDGVCVFENGAKKRIEGTMTVDFIEGGTNYVYLLNNVSGNVIQLVNSLTAPTSGDFVMLAEISVDKVVKDVRVPSKAKFGNNGANITTEFSVILPKGTLLVKDEVAFSIEVSAMYSHIYFGPIYYGTDGSQKTNAAALLRLSDMVFMCQYSDFSGTTTLNYDYLWYPFKIRAERAGDLVNFIYAGFSQGVSHEKLTLSYDYIYSGVFL